MWCSRTPLEQSQVLLELLPTAGKPLTLLSFLFALKVSRLVVVEVVHVELDQRPKSGLKLGHGDLHGISPCLVT